MTEQRDEIFDIELGGRCLYKFKKVITPTKTIWQIYDEESRKWQKSSEAVFKVIWDDIKIATREVLIEKIDNFNF